MKQRRLEMELTEFMDARERFASFGEHSDMVGMEKPDRPTSAKKWY